MPISLTKSQADCARVIAELTCAMGCAPTVREVAAELDCNIGTVERLFDQLEERGWLERLPYRARGTRLLFDPPAACESDVEITDARRLYLGGDAA